MKLQQTIEKSGLKPRLDPIEQPDGMMLKLSYWYSEKMIGKVIQARFPESLKLSRDLISVAEKIDLDKELVFLIKSYVATLNGCAFCVDIAKAHAKDRRLNTAKYNELLRFEESSVFSEAEKAALSYTEEVTLTKQASDSTFDRLRGHFNDRQIVEITWLIASEHYYNLMNRPLNIGSDGLCQIRKTREIGK